MAQPEITCSKLIILEQRVKYVNNKETIKKPERRHQWRRSGVFSVSFEHISYVVLVFLLSTLSR